MLHVLSFTKTTFFSCSSKGFPLLVVNYFRDALPSVFIFFCFPVTGLFFLQGFTQGAALYFLWTVLFHSHFSTRHPFNTCSFLSFLFPFPFVPWQCAGEGQHVHLSPISVTHLLSPSLTQPHLSLSSVDVGASLLLLSGAHFNDAMMVVFLFSFFTALFITPYPLTTHLFTFSCIILPILILSSPSCSCWLES